MPAPRASEGCVGRKPGCISIPRQRRRADLQLDRVAPPLHHRSLTKSVDLSLIVRGVERSCSPRRPGIGWASATSGRRRAAGVAAGSGIKSELSPEKEKRERVPGSRRVGFEERSRTHMPYAAAQREDRCERQGVGGVDLVCRGDYSAPARHVVEAVVRVGQPERVIVEAHCQLSQRLGLGSESEVLEVSPAG